MRYLLALAQPAELGHPSRLATVTVFHLTPLGNSSISTARQ
jgi:hypothetical protein